jgi:DNA-binding PadR family transcriptional regulator
MHESHSRRFKTASAKSSLRLWPTHPFPRRKKSGRNDLMAQIRKGTTAWIVLATLEKRGELYGYGLRREVFVNSKGLFPLKEGPLYPLLKKMERERWLTSKRVEVAGRERRYYRIRAPGRRILAQYRREWRLLSSVLQSLGCLHA